MMEEQVTVPAPPPPPPRARRERWILGFSLGVNVVLAGGLVMVASRLPSNKSFEPPREEIAGRVDSMLDQVDLPRDLQDKLRERFMASFDHAHGRMEETHGRRGKLMHDMLVNPDDEDAAQRMQQYMGHVHRAIDTGALELLRGAARDMTPEQRDRFATVVVGMMAGAKPGS